MPEADTKTLDALASKMKADASRSVTLSSSAVASIAEIIETAIGAPVNWPCREAGAIEADKLYSGSPSHRLAFNAGVKWAVEQYSATVTIKNR